MAVNSSNPGANAFRRDAYEASLRGRRFVATNVTNTPIALQTAYASTTPTLMLLLSNATRRVVFRSMVLSLTTTGGGDHVRTIVVADTANRWSAGGTAVTPYSLNEVSPIASVVTAFYISPTVTAAGATARPVTHVTSLNSVGIPLMINYSDGLIQGKTSSLLFYFFTPSPAAATAFFTAEWDEVE